MALKPVTVSQLNDYISRVIGTDPLLGAVTVKGEISGIKYHASGHVYFAIVDQLSKLSCFLPREYAQTLPQLLTDGLEVTLTGSIRVYRKNGTYSLYVRNVEISGEGCLAAAFEKMKEKLSREGLFDQSHKKTIPEFPKKIGIITSETGAAVQDILKILQKRNRLVDVMIFPVLVQGEDAAADISRMIDYVNLHFDDIDTLIVGRGGGSAEDLWAFNEEIVARAIWRSEIPVISAVGHEIDFTIADFAADLRAETPTAAAQLAVPDTKQLSEKLSALKETLSVHLSNRLMYMKLRADSLNGEIKSQLSEKISSCCSRAERCRVILEENNPARILENGYSIVTGSDGTVLSSVTDTQPGAALRVHLCDGFADCLVTGTERNDL